MSPDMKNLVDLTSCPNESPKGIVDRNPTPSDLQLNPSHASVERKANSKSLNNASFGSNIVNGYSMRRWWDQHPRDEPFRALRMSDAR